MLKKTRTLFYEDEILLCVDYLNKSNLSFEELSYILEILVDLWEDNNRLARDLYDYRRKERD